MTCGHILQRRPRPGVASLAVAILSVLACADGVTAPPGGEARPLSASARRALEALASLMDRCHVTFPVYTDVSSPCSHFFAFGKIPGAGAPVAVYGSETATKHSGATSLRFSLTATSRDDFGGYYLLTGVLPAGAVAPIPDFGTVPNAGYDLWGATRLTFWARGSVGGEVVDFFVGGVGRDPATGEPQAVAPYPESFAVSTKRVTLAAEWQRYELPVAGRDLSYVLSGFGWVASVRDNPNGVTFYVDDVEFQLTPLGRHRRLAEPRFIVSFVTHPLQPDPCSRWRASIRITSVSAELGTGPFGGAGA